MTSILSTPTTFKPNPGIPHRVRWIARKCAVPVTTAQAIDSLVFGGGSNG